MLFRLLIASAVASTALKLPAMLRPTSSASRGAISTIRMEETDFDLVVVGCGVGGHGAALHAVSKGLVQDLFAALIMPQQHFESPPGRLLQFAPQHAPQRAPREVRVVLLAEALINAGEVA